MASSEDLVNAYNCTMTSEKTNLLQVLNTVHIFVVGDETTKTCIIRAFTNVRIKDAFLPSFDSVYTYTHRTIPGPLEFRIVELQREDLFLKEIRLISRTRQRVFIFVVSIDSIAGGYRVSRTWVACVEEKMGPGVPSVLVCNKIDLSQHYKVEPHRLLVDNFVNSIRQACGISSFFGCSAIRGEMVQEVFFGAAMIGNKHKP
ncbi:hypothetical protein CDAR_170351 [Caerostris darwini]|uniref:Uncharacterized protein n=1 Tax=Caerostris darwini TaxID=1538125 RepID=A0AAV4R3C0_9ARAC|nr:hypothetical protein CDAR_170351 [Caerostris darwini]